MSENGGYPGIEEERSGDTPPGLRPLQALLRNAERETLKVVVRGGVIETFGWLLVDCAASLEERRRFGRGGFVPILRATPWLPEIPSEDKVDRGPRAALRPAEAADDCDAGGEA